ncbi:helix-turn-helix domain-containing protein, partial [Salipiger pacificus]|nr:helix-turn-helix domain-containing protein [Alloyangia pacifica]
SLKVSLTEPVTMTDTNGDTLSPQNAAEISGYSRTTIRQALETKELKGIRNNRGHWRIRRPDLDEWLRTKEPKATTASDDATGTPLTVSVATTETFIENATLRAELKASLDLIAERDQRIQELKADLAAERGRLDRLLEDRRGRGLGAFLSKLRGT